MPFIDDNHGSLDIWKSIYSLQEEIFVQQGASFVSFPVTKPVVTQGTTRYQIKDLDIIFPLIPHSLQPFKVKQMFKKLKMLKIDQLCSAKELNFLNTFFQMATILRKIEILT